MTETLVVGRIAVVGTGLIGASWSAWFAGHGFPVSMYDSNPEALRKGETDAAEQLAFLERHGLTTPPSPTHSSRLKPANSLEEAVQGADLVIEAVAESYDVKVPLFAQLDELTPAGCLLTSSSSGLLISRLQAGLRHPERVLIAHPFNPVHLVPLVELVAGAQTAPRHLNFLQTFLERYGKTVVVVRKEVPGYIGNRLQAAIWREAIQLVLDGVGSVADIDRALTAGPGLRWALMGQHLIFHLGGGEGGIEGFIDHIGGKWESLWSDMATWTALPSSTKDALSEGIRDSLGGLPSEALVTWRDEQLAQLQRVITPPPKQLPSA